MKDNQSPIDQYLKFFKGITKKDFKKTVTKDEIVEMLENIKDKSSSDTTTIQKAS